MHVTPFTALTNHPTVSVNATPLPFSQDSVIFASLGVMGGLRCVNHPELSHASTILAYVTSECLVWINVVVFEQDATSVTSLHLSTPKMAHLTIRLQFAFSTLSDV